MNIMAITRVMSDSFFIGLLFSVSAKVHSQIYIFQIFEYGNSTEIVFVTISVL